MSEDAVTSPLIQRLAVERLGAPGILDSRKLQRAQARVGTSSSAPMLDRLMRRVESTTRGAEGLLLARSYRVTESDESTALGHESFPSAQSTSAVEHAAPRTSGARGAEEFAGQVHVVGRTPTDAGPTSSLTPARAATAGTPSITPIKAASSVVQRVAERASDSGAADTTRATIVARSFAPTAPAPLVVMRRAEPIALSAASGSSRRAGNARDAAGQSLSRVAPTVVGHASGIPHHSAATIDAHGESGSGSGHSTIPLLWRKPDVAESSVSRGVSNASAPNVVGTAATSLVFRKAATPASAAAFSAARATPSIASTIMKAPAATNVIARAAEPTEPTEAAGSSTQMGGPQMDLDWLTQQVSSRLARRLEIERERLGVRPWRQSSF